MQEFEKAILENDIKKLNTLKKIDIHNHAVHSCKRSYLSQRGINISDYEITDIKSLINFSRTYISPLQLDIDGLRILLEGNFDNCIIE